MASEPLWRVLKRMSKAIWTAASPGPLRHFTAQFTQSFGRLYSALEPSQYWPTQGPWTSNQFCFPSLNNHCFLVPLMINVAFTRYDRERDHTLIAMYDTSG